MRSAKLFFFVIALLLQFETVLSANPKPIAKKGILDLREWSFAKDGMISLEGEWEFYWNQLLEPEYFENNKEHKKLNFIQVPKNWKNYQNKTERLTNIGYATYHLTILTSGKREHLKMFYFLQMVSSKCYVNGELIISAGVVGTKKEESTISLIHENIDFVGKTDTLEIIIQVSNFQNPKGGLFSDITLGTAKQIHNIIDKKTISDSFLLGVFMLMALYHIVLFLLRRRSLSNVFFALSCFGFFLNYAFTEGAFSSFFPELGFDYIFRFVFTSLTIVVAAFFLFVHSLFTEDYNKRIAQIIAGTGVLFIFIALSPKKILHSDFVTAFTQIYLILGSLYTMFVIIKASIKKREDNCVLS